jgi:uncharacterized protein YggE
MIRSRFTTPVLVVSTFFVVLSPGLLGGRPAFASAAATMDSSPADPSRESVLVTGTGEASGEPDTLTVDFGVESGGSTIAQAVDSANSAAARMRDTLLRAGVARADLQSSNFNVGTKVNDAQTIVGYTVSEGLTAKIRDLKRAGDIMSAAIAAGGDAARLNGVSFGIEKDTALLAEARRKAFADARQKAELYAREAGRPLGRVLQVSEAVPGYGGPVVPFAYAPAAMASRFPIEPGRQRLTVTVTVEWALDPQPPRAPLTGNRPGVDPAGRTTRAAATA